MVEWRFRKVHQRPSRIMEARVMWTEILKDAGHPVVIELSLVIAL